MTIKIHNLSTGDNFTLQDRPERLAEKLDSELSKRKWEEEVCRVEILGGKIEKN